MRGVSLKLPLARRSLQARCCDCSCRSCCCCCGCCGCTVLSFFLSFLFFPISLPLPLQQGSGSLRPCHRREPVRLPFWLLARFVDGLAPSACVVRRPYGSTMRSSTMSCAYSTHHFLRALNSFPSLLQRMSLALSSLLFLHALPGPQHLFLLFAPPVLFLSSLFLFLRILRLLRLMCSPLFIFFPFVFAFFSLL